MSFSTFNALFPMHLQTPVAIELCIVGSRRLRWPEANVWGLQYSQLHKLAMYMLVHV